MSACLWADIDAYLLAAVTTDMGAASTLYSTLKIATVKTGEAAAVNPDHYTLPLVVIDGYEMDPGDNYPHADGAIHLDAIRYPYLLAAYTTATTATQAKADGQELLRRFRELLRSRYALGGLTATDGETVTETEIGNGGVAVRGIGGTNTGKYLAIAGLELEVLTSI